MKFWTDKKIRELSQDEAFVFFYLVTNPNSHMSGIYRLPLDYIVVDLSYWSLTKDRVLAALDGLVASTMVMWDQESDTVYVKKMLHYQGNTNNPKVMAGVESHLEDIESSALERQFRIDYRLVIDYQSISDPVQPEQNYPQEQLTGTGTGTGTVVQDLSPSQKSETENKSEVTIIGSSPATKFGDIDVKQIIKTVQAEPSPSAGMRGNPWATELRELQQLYSDVTKTRMDPHPVTLDLHKRMCRALDCYQLDGCQAAIRGLYRLASKEGSQRIMSLPKCFPEGSKSGRRRSDYLDQSLFVEFIAAAPPSQKEKQQKEQEDKQQDSALVAPPSEEQIQKNLELIRATKRKLGSGKK